MARPRWATAGQGSSSAATATRSVTASTGAANVVSGNGNEAVVIAGDDNTVEGNLIGTDATGAALLGNRDGVVVEAGGHNRVGGGVAGEGNVISGNGTGVDVRTDATETADPGQPDRHRQHRPGQLRRRGRRHRDRHRIQSRTSAAT